MVPPLLFARSDIFSVLRARQEALKAAVDQLDSRTIEGVPEQELVRGLAGKYKLEMPVLEDENAKISHREVEVDVSGDPSRLIWDRGSPFYIKGTEVTISVPFKGNPGLFQVQPSTFSLNPPRGEVRANEVDFVYTRTDDNPDALKADYQRDLQGVRQHLAWLETSVSNFNSGIGQQAQNLVAQRRRKLAASAGMVAALGLPARREDAQSASRPPLATKAVTKGISSPKKWDVFISHASEDKDEIVRPLALALRGRGVSVWYDEFSLKMGDSLRASIDFGLANSRFGVAVLSHSFFAKHWPMQELNGLATREVNGKKVILPIWHRIGFKEVRNFSPILADRFAISADVGIERLVEEIIKVLEED
ncbi:MAG TPA: toll/interleukin-1 receptor domain-containing protein [Terriglobia bacterium]|nr:toll/interleukin-1 receptor domain-containing protein [Terriglobia bacterium]